MSTPLGRLHPAGPVAEEDLAAPPTRERRRLAKIEHFTTEEWGWQPAQSTRPETVAYALGDSPVGQLAWIVEKFAVVVVGGRHRPRAGVDRDRMLTNITLYWL